MKKQIILFSIASIVALGGFNSKSLDIFSIYAQFSSSTTSIIKETDTTTRDTTSTSIEDKTIEQSIAEKTIVEETKEETKEETTMLSESKITTTTTNTENSTTTTTTDNELIQEREAILKEQEVVAAEENTTTQEHEVAIKEQEMIAAEENTTAQEREVAIKEQEMIAAEENTTAQEKIRVIEQETYEELKQAEELRKIQEMEALEKDMWIPDETQVETIKEHKIQEVYYDEAEELKIEYLKSLDEKMYESVEVVRDAPVVQETIIYGCMNADACNYNPKANKSDRSCVYCGGEQICTRKQICCDDPDGNRECGDQRIPGCTNRGACNYNPNAQIDDGTCILPLGCDYTWCPGDYGTPHTIDQCGICGGDGQSCIQKEQETKPEPEKQVIDTPTNVTPIEAIEDVKEIEQTEPTRETIVHEVEVDEHNAIEETYVEPNNYKQETKNTTEHTNVTDSVITPSPKPFSLQMSDETLTIFRQCLGNTTDHTQCVRDSMQSENDGCMNTVTGMRYGTVLSLTDIDYHTCTKDTTDGTQQKEPAEAQHPPQVEYITFKDEKIEETNQSTTAYVPVNAPSKITFKKDELYITVNNETITIETVIDAIEGLGVTIDDVNQPFKQTGLTEIYKLSVIIENDAITLDTILRTIEQHKTKRNEENEEIAIPEEETTIHNVPIFKIAQKQDNPEAATGNVENAGEKTLPYYFTQLGWQEFIDQCGDTNTPVKIAVIDNAFDISHEDLQENVVYSYDVADDDDDTSPPQSADRAWNHGNIAAGIIGATASNDIGVVGVANDHVELYLLKATSDGAAGEDITAGVEAIAKAIELNVDIINISWGAYIDHPVVRKVIKKAEDAGIIIIAAAGNYDSNEPFFPAAYKSVISVGAIDKESKKASFSNYGNWVNTVMYGVDIASTDLDNDYNTFNGTSESSPLFAGLLGLSMSHGVAYEKLFQTTHNGKPVLSLKDICAKKSVEKTQKPDNELSNHNKQQPKDNQHDENHDTDTTTPKHDDNSRENRIKNSLNSLKNAILDPQESLGAEHEKSFIQEYGLRGILLFSVMTNMFVIIRLLKKKPNR